MSDEDHTEAELSRLLDGADFIILRRVKQDNVGNSEFEDMTISGSDHNRIVAALRNAAR